MCFPRGTKALKFCPSNVALLKKSGLDNPFFGFHGGSSTISWHSLPGFENITPSTTYYHRT
jgi:hypothetical protein